MSPHSWWFSTDGRPAATNGVVVTACLTGPSKISHMRPFARRGFRGFTLVELMVAVVVAGILAAVAYPAFTSFIKRSRRADAVAALTAVVQAQERYRTSHTTYAKSVDTLGLNANDVFAKAYKYYDVSFASLDETTPFASGYTVTATPKTGSPQTRDSDCASMSVKLEGALFTYAASDSAGTDKANQCWGR